MSFVSSTVPFEPSHGAVVYRITAMGARYTAPKAAAGGCGSCLFLAAWSTEAETRLRRVLR